MMLPELRLRIIHFAHLEFAREFMQSTTVLHDASVPMTFDCDCAHGCITGFYTIVHARLAPWRARDQCDWCWLCQCIAVQILHTWRRVSNGKHHRSK